jgi:hypothetical protein
LFFYLNVELRIFAGDVQIYPLKERFLRLFFRKETFNLSPEWRGFIVESLGAKLPLNDGRLFDVGNRDHTTVTVSRYYQSCHQHQTPLSLLWASGRGEVSETHLAPVLMCCIARMVRRYPRNGKHSHI